MKKIIIYLIISSLFLPYTNKVFSYGIDFDGSNFYTKIADSAGELDSKLYTLELSSGDGISKKIENKLGKNCLNGNLTEKEIKSISSGNTGLLLNKINDNCKGEDGNISQNTFIKLTNSIIELHNETKNTAIKKSNQVQDISKVGIYTDGITENSPFDLVKDIELIDEIIFEKTEEYDFEGDGNVDLSKKIKEKLDKQEKEIKKETEKEIEIKNTNSSNSINYTLCKINGKCDTQTEFETFLCEKLGNCPQKKGELFEIIESEQICKENKSGLKNISEKILGNSIGKKIKKDSDEVKNNNVNNSNKGNSGLNGNKQNSQDKQDIENKKPKGNYKKVNDNSEFPCNNFFCIKVSYDTYSHNLFGGWVGTSPSIEYLIKRSNKHLKKFANSSLAQSKMTINNFELGLKDLDLSNMFHMSTYVTSKPVPILDLNKDFKNNKDKDGGEDKSIYKFENQLREYYKSLGLNYDRKNDLSLLNNIEFERLGTEKSSYLSPKAFVEHLDEYYKQKNENRKKIEIFEKTIQEEVRSSIISDFEEQFKEIEVFSKKINEYISNLDAILDGMLKIPSDTGVN